jgi:hypothetical protein
MKRSSLNPMRVTLVVAGILAVNSTAAAEQVTGAVANAAPGTATPAPHESPVAQPGSFGIGLIAGEPTGLSMKYWFNDRMAMDAAAAWSFTRYDGFQLHADWLFHVFDVFRIDRGELPLYVGIGGRAKFPDHGDNRVGVRFPIGIAYEVKDAPIEFFAEVAPIVDVAPAIQLKWNGGIGIRYFFH